MSLAATLIMIGNRHAVDGIIGNDHIKVVVALSLFHTNLEVTMYTLIYFSPTGNALHLAKMLANRLHPENVEILALESIEADKLANNKHLVLLYPVHGFNAPRNVKRFVKHLPPGLYNTVSLIGVGCTTGWVNHAVSTDLRKLFSKKGYPIILDEILAMPLTFVMSFPDELAHKLIAESEKKIEDIGESLPEGQKTTVRVAGKSRLLTFLGKAEPFASRLFGLELYAGEDCISCGTCWENCPEKNIERNDNGKPRFGFDCLMCMRCIYNCPEKAISPRFSKFLPIKNGYSFSQYSEE
jgi:ferredoxin